MAKADAETANALMRKSMDSMEREIIERITMAEAVLDDAEGSARVLALDLMGFNKARECLRRIKAEMALRIFIRGQSQSGS
jgi:hypothetical protein